MINVIEYETLMIIIDQILEQKKDETIEMIADELISRFAGARD